MKYIFRLIILAVLLNSCIGEKNIIPFSNEVFDLESNTLLKDVLLDPWDILLIDSVLIIANNKGLPVIEIYDIKGKSLQNFLTLGQGPEEVLAVGHLETVNSSLYIYDLFQKKFLEYSYFKIKNSNVLKPDSVHSYSFISNSLDENLLGKLYRGYDCLIGEIKSSDSRIALIDFEGNVISRGGSYPPPKDDLSDYENAGLYSSSFTLNKSKTKIVLATFMADMIDIFDISNNSIASVWTYQGFLPHGYTTIQMGDMQRAAMTDKSQYGYADITSSDKYIYAIYSGRFLGEDNYSYGNIIRVLSWDASERFELHTDLDINRLTVSSDDQYIYAIAKDKEGSPLVVSYNLAKIKK